MNDRSTRPAGASLEHAGQAGFLAALIMLAVQLIWRLNWSDQNLVQAFPEFIVAAVSRLTPLSIFGAATENYGSLAKKTLLLVVLIGIAGVGIWAGRTAALLTRYTGTRFTGRLIAGGIVTAALLLFTLVVIMPIAYLGIFARKSSYTNDVLLQLFLTFGLFAVAWAVLTSPQIQVATDDAELEQLDRREALRRGVFNGATLAGLVAVGASFWRLVNPKTAEVDTAATQQAVQDIVATQRAKQGLPVPTTEPEAASRESASLTSDLLLDQDVDTLALFQELDQAEKITPILTATPDFYHVSKNIVDPTVDADGWSLQVTGHVEKELEINYGDLVQRATTQNITTLCCISNELNGDLISTAQWTGVPLVDLLNEAGLKEGAVDIKFHAADDYEDSVSVEVGMDPDNLVVIGMNGETLPDDHGFPARLIIPNIYGMKNVKWLDRIEVVEEDFQGYWQTRGWSDTAVTQIWGRIDFPTRKEIDPGPQTLTGLASAGARDVSRVEVSLDEGKSWVDAILEPSLNPPFTWVRWALQIDAKPGEYKMRIRVTDGEGTVMDEEDRQPLPDGATGYPKRTLKVKD
jgi:DMSO/TMAO reductase YedYZ molybdopterin-dependent catalytic subunit